MKDVQRSNSDLSNRTLLNSMFEKSTTSMDAPDYNILPDRSSQIEESDHQQEGIEQYYPEVEIDITSTSKKYHLPDTFLVWNSS